MCPSSMEIQIPQFTQLGDLFCKINLFLMIRNCVYFDKFENY